MNGRNILFAIISLLSILIFSTSAYATVVSGSVDSKDPCKGVLTLYCEVCVWKCEADDNKYFIFYANSPTGECSCANSFIDTLYTRLMNFLFGGILNFSTFSSIYDNVDMDGINYNSLRPMDTDEMVDMELGKYHYNAFRGWTYVTQDDHTYLGKKDFYIAYNQAQNMTVIASHDVKLDNLKDMPGAELSEKKDIDLNGIKATEQDVAIKSQDGTVYGKLVEIPQEDGAASFLILTENKTTEINPQELINVPKPDETTQPEGTGDVAGEDQDPLATNPDNIAGEKESFFSMIWKSISGFFSGIFGFFAGLFN